MQLINYDNFSFLNTLIESNAKYQKVAVIYDDCVSNVVLDEVYRTIKQNCVYNQFNIKQDIQEIYNGYKLLIFLCGTNNFLHLKINLSEFICVFLPSDDGMLPYYLINYKISGENNYLCLKQGVADAGVLPSICFNYCFNYINELIYDGSTKVEPCIEDIEVTQLALKKMLNDVSKEIEFLDILILSETQINYRQLSLLDYILSCALCCFIKAIKNRTLNLVDIYKVVGDNYTLLDRYYAMANDSLVLNIIKLNANALLHIADKTRLNILYHLTDTTSEDIEDVIKQIKLFAKTDDGLLGYLYLYNVFDV